MPEALWSAAPLNSGSGSPFVPSGMRGCSLRRCRLPVRGLCFGRVWPHVVLCRSPPARKRGWRIRAQPRTHPCAFIQRSMLRLSAGVASQLTARSRTGNTRTICRRARVPSRSSVVTRYDPESSRGLPVGLPTPPTLRIVRVIGTPCHSTVYGKPRVAHARRGSSQSVG